MSRPEIRSNRRASRRGADHGDNDRKLHATANRIPHGLHRTEGPRGRHRTWGKLSEDADCRVGRNRFAYCFEGLLAEDLQKIFVQDLLPVAGRLQENLGCPVSGEVPLRADVVDRRRFPSDVRGHFLDPTVLNARSRVCKAEAEIIARGAGSQNQQPTRSGPQIAEQRGGKQFMRDQPVLAEKQEPENEYALYYTRFNRPSESSIKTNLRP